MTKHNHTPALNIPQDLHPIPGYENLYAISRDGSVYNLKRGRFLKHTLMSVGYFHVNLAKDGKIKSGYIHRLLMLTFFPCENSSDLDVNHIDGNKANNALSNLEWCTHRENIIHARQVLKAWPVYGKRVLMSPSDVDLVFKLRNEGIRHRKIADILKVSIHTIRNIIAKYKKIVP